MKFLPSMVLILIGFIYGRMTAAPPEVKPVMPVFTQDVEPEPEGIIYL